MMPSIKDRFAFWLERFTIIHPLLLKLDGIAPSGKLRYKNRINGHVILKEIAK
ncbi:hypothetical protein [Cryobacterium sp. Hh7]|uniref:hypothetical protein n=1 Tax=Cryobacterium sp. Hh7 TaxID=1259159 RepID=UPI00141BF2D1|nr:hypothetical protein [Cryobacterium sp. Hh7]